MFEIELGRAMIMYSAVLACVAAGIWLHTELSISRPQQRLGKQYLWRCTICGYSYLDEEAAKLSRCPRCHSYNSTEDTGAHQGLHSDQPEANPDDDRDKGRNTSKQKRHGQSRRGPRRRR